MRSEDIQSTLRKRPFQPFRIHLSNGAKFEVRHPELVVVGRSTMFIGNPAPDLPVPTYEDFDLVSLLQTNNLEPLPSSAPPMVN